MNITIRLAVLEDYQKIRPLQKEIADLHHDGRPDLFKAQARYFSKEAFTERLNDPKHTVFVAETEEKQIVGYAFAWVIPYRNHPTYRDFDCFYIDDICVLKTYQRQGIGKQLFAHCKQEAQNRSCKMMDLGVYAFNKEAIAFYESCGMTERLRKMEYRLEE